MLTSIYGNLISPALNAKECLMSSNGRKGCTPWIFEGECVKWRCNIIMNALRHQSCKNVPTVPTSWCYFFWPVLIFGKSTRKTGENTRKQAKTRENRRKTGAFLVLIFWGGKLVSANFYAFCNYVWHAWWYFVVNLLTEVAPWEFSKNQGSISSLLLGLAQGLMVLRWNKNLQQCQNFCKG